MPSAQSRASDRSDHGAWPQRGRRHPGLGSVDSARWTRHSDVSGRTVGAVATFTFFVDGDLYFYGGGELPATEEDLREAGVWKVEIPTAYGLDLSERIPVQVEGTAAGLRFYAGLLGLRDPLQREELERVLAAAERRERTER